MIEIDLQNIPNQEFVKIINDVKYDIRIRTFKGLTLMDIAIDDVDVKTGVRCMPNKIVIPYSYLTKDGNFYWYCKNDDYPNYKLFGITQQLVFFTNEELEKIGQ